MTQLSPGKLPGLFAAITCEMLGGLTSQSDPDYELIVRRQWGKIRILFDKYGLSLASEPDLIKAELDLKELLRSLPQGYSPKE